MIVKTLSTAFAGVATGVLFVASMISPPPIIELVSIEIDLEKQTVFYKRKVNSDKPIRGTFVTELVHVNTESSVVQCELVGRATFDPDENQLKVFTLREFAGPDCWGALVSGEKYQIVASVAAGRTETDELFSEPWVQP